MMNNGFFNKEDSLSERIENEKIKKKLYEPTITDIINRIDNEIKNYKNKIKELEEHRKIINTYKE